MDIVHVLLQILIILLLIHHHVNPMRINYAQAESNIAAEYCSATSCGNNNIPYPFGTSSACAFSSSFLLSNCSSPHPSWDAFTQSLQSDYMNRNIVFPPTLVMGIFSANSYSTYINLAWDSDLHNSSACSIPVPLSNLPSAIPPSTADLSTFADSTLRFSPNNVFLLFNCTKSTAAELRQVGIQMIFTLTVEANTAICQSYRSQCANLMGAEYYTTTGHCVQLSRQGHSVMSTQLNLQNVMDDLQCTHFQFFVTNTLDAPIKEWSRGTIQLQWTTSECWNCVQNLASCVLDSTNHTFEKCTECPLGVDISDPRYCSEFSTCSDGSAHYRLFGRIRTCHLHEFIIVVSVAPIAGTLLILLALIYCRRRIRRRRREVKPTGKPIIKLGRKHSVWPPMHELSSGLDIQSLDDLDLNGLAESPMEYSYSSIASATRFFSCMVGEGGFGVVFKGVLDEQEIAVKVLEAKSKQSRKQFLNEVAIIGRVHHVNVVRLLGVCTQHEEHPRMLVYEYVENGSLDAWLFSSSDTKLAGHQEQTVIKELDWGQRYMIALGVARGLSYLHEECRHRIVHCDIKPQNILLDACMCPKIADFGLARIMSRDESRVVTLAKGTPGYMAPEFWVGGDIELSTKADVYSYGMMLLELVSGRRNFAFGCRRFPAVAFEAAMCSDLESIIDVRLQAVMPVAEEERFVMKQQVRTAILVALWCIQEEPRRRPSMSEVVQYLEGIAAVSEQPPQPPPRPHCH